METNFTPWNDQLEIEGDAREEVAKEGFDNLETEEEIAEFEEFLDEGDYIGADGDALESVYGPND